MFLTANSVSGQQPGDTVRVSGEQVGVVVEADSAGLLLFSGYAPYAEMQSLELWAGTKRQPGRGFQKGFLVGATLGVGVGVFFALIFGGGNDPDDYVKAGGVYGVVGGVLGGVVGALAAKSDIWEPVLIPGGFSLRLAVGGRSPS